MGRNVIIDPNSRRPRGPSMRRTTLLLACLLACLPVSVPAATPPSSADLITVAERSGFQRTGRYEEVLALCDAFAERYPDAVRCESFGTTPQGRARTEEHTAELQTL